MFKEKREMTERFMDKMYAAMNKEQDFMAAQPGQLEKVCKAVVFFALKDAQDPQLVYDLLDLSQVRFDEEGLPGLEEAIAKVRMERPYLFKNGAFFDYVPPRSEPAADAFLTGFMR